MEWIVGTGADIAVSRNQLQARKIFIERVTGVAVSPWNVIQISGKNRFLHCSSGDAVEGVFITAHINDVIQLGTLNEICSRKFVVANTCVWAAGSDKELLHSMRLCNSQVELFFAKQEVSIDDEKVFRRSNTICEVGLFGFQTSASERNLFKNRDMGLHKAIQDSFERVSPILLKAKKLYAHLSAAPANQQTAEWNKLLCKSKEADRGNVLEAQRMQLMTREICLATISLLVLNLSAVIVLAIIKGSFCNALMLLGLPIGYLAIMLIVTRTAAKSRAKRLVCLVIKNDVQDSDCVEAK